MPPTLPPIMTGFRRFDLDNIDDLNREMDSLSLHLPISTDLGILGEDVSIGSRILPNRFVIQPMEGVDADPATGSPSSYTFRRYRRYAQGGSGLIWAEAVSVVPEGCSNARQMRLTSNNLDDFKRLTEETRRAAAELFGHDITMIVQLTHSGRFSRPGGVASPQKAQNNPWLDDMLGMADLDPVDDDDLDSLQEAFVRTAELAVRAGFDGVDMKAVHGYLVAELLGAHRREGKYGGSYENRTRFLRETSRGMMEVLPSSAIVTTRMTVLEPCPYPYGWGVKPVVGDGWELDLTEPKRMMTECLAAGMPLFNVSIGFPRFQPYLNRPHDNTLVGQDEPPEYPLLGVARYQDIVREMQSVDPSCPVPTAGLAWLRHLLPEVAAGLVEHGWCSLVGLGRSAFAYPDLPKDLFSTGRISRSKCCTTCSMCTQIMKDGVGRAGCVIRDRRVYGPELKSGRSAVGLSSE